MKCDARGAPEDRELHQVSREHQPHDARDGQREVPEEDPLAPIAAEVVAAELQDGCAEERHQREHHRAEAIDSQGEPEPGDAEQRAHERWPESCEPRGERGDRERHQHGGAGGGERGARSWSLVTPGDDRREDEAEQREKGHECERAGHGPRSTEVGPVVPID